MENLEEIEPERHTEEIQDIITKVPSWIIRWGITVFFLVLLIVGAISAIVSYPDVVKSRIRFQPVEPDYKLISPTSAVIKKVQIGQNANVQAGQVLAVLHTADGKELNINSPLKGRVGFASILQPGTSVQHQQSLFVIHPFNQHFFGLIQIPVNDAGVVKTGQRVLITLGNKDNGDPRQIQGMVSALTDEPDGNGLITAKVALNDTGPLISWATGDAQVMTRNSSVWQRIWKSITRKL